MAQQRERLPNRRLGETFELEVAGLRYIATVSRFPDGRLGEIFLSNLKSNSAADTNARDSAIVCSIALQCGADPETIRRALCRDSGGRPSGPLGAALDRIAEEEDKLALLMRAPTQPAAAERPQPDSDDGVSDEMPFN